MAHTGRSLRWTSGLAAAALIGGILAAPWGPAMASPRTPVSPARPGTAGGADPTGTALRQARKSGKRVAVAAAMTATDALTANPDGTLTLDRTLVPTRKKVDGSWRDLDATLHRNGDGTVAPALTLGDVRLSGGGNGPLATMSSAGTSLSFTAPMPLPAPVLSAGTATYGGVLPGVDIVVTADQFGGVQPVVVVKDAAAAANPAVKSLTFATTTSGLTLTADAHGNLSAADRLKQAVFTASTPTGWDSAATASAAKAARSMTAAQAGNAAHGRALLSSTAGPGETADQVPLAVNVTDHSLTLTPPPSLLAGPGTVYPVYLDPTWTLASWGASKSGWASVAKSLPTSNKWNSTPDPNPDIMQVGNADGWIARSMVNFPIDVSRLRGATISTATLELTNTHSYSCTATRTNLYAPTTLLKSGNATWDAWENVAPGSLIANPSFAHGYTGCAGDGVSFDIRTAIGAAIGANRTTQTFWLRSPDETNSEDYKEFSSKSAKISVSYNHAPTTPTSLTTSPAVSCAATAATAKTIGDGSVSLYAKVADADGQTLGVTFKLAKSSAPGTPLISTSPNDVTASSGTTSVYVVTRDTLHSAAPNNVTEFQWTVQTTDGFASSGVSAPCYFKYDPTRTGAPTVVLTTTAPTIGQDATFTVTPPVTGVIPTAYLYQLNGGAPGLATADSTGNATFTVTPNRFTNVIAVTSTSIAGNIGETRAPVFNAAPAATAVDGDLTGDGITDLLSPGGTGLSPGLWLAPGTGAGSGTPYRINPAGRNLGVYGTGIVSAAGGPNDFAGTEAVTGHFNGTGLQDVFVYYPTGTHAGEGVIIDGNGDGSPVKPDTNNSTKFRSDLLTDAGAVPAQLANAGDVSAQGWDYPDLIGVGGNSTTGYYLAMYPNSGAVSAYNESDPLASTRTPTDGNDWNTWTIATAQLPDGATDMFLWQKTTGSLYLWTDLAYDQSTGAFSYTPHPLANAWNTNQTLTLTAADVNNDGTPDLRTVGGGGAVTAYLVTGLTATTATLTAQASQTVMTSNHAWVLDDATDGAVTTAHDAIGTLDLTAAGGATWNSGDLFDPDLDLNGTSAVLTTAAPAVSTNADFTISVWAKSNSATAYGTVLSQDGTNGESMRLYADNGTWRFGLTQTDTAGSPWDIATSPAGNVQAGVWTLLTATYRQSGGLMNLYINGGLVGRATHTKSHPAANSFRVGAHKNGQYFAGQVAQVQTWNRVANGNVAIFGFLPSRQLTYTEIDSATGDHVKDLTTTVVLPWTPKAMAVLNATTILVTDTAGILYRIDITSTDTTLYFNPPTQIDTAWTFDLLTADGAGKLFGISNGRLYRNDLTKAKPAGPADFANRILIDNGFVLNTLTATGPNWILGTYSDGTLRNYNIIGAGNWAAAINDPGGWGFVNLMSPGGGLYYGRRPTGGVYRYKDANPYDLNGSDIQYYTSDPVDTTGWNQTLLSAQPNTVG